MMNIPFWKMNGAGNDFVMVDNRDRSYGLDRDAIRRICDRRRGVGADGVILVEPDASADFRMRYYNADGGEAEMCGNGARCVAYFARTLGLGAGDNGNAEVRFQSDVGLMTAKVAGDRVAVGMTDAHGLEVGIKLPVAGREETVHFVNTGVPHAIVAVEDASALTDEEVESRGRAIRKHNRFEPDGANANFVSVRDDGVALIRTYERGVEAETLACGTGSVAAAVVLAALGKVESPVELMTHGGEKLVVSFAPTDTGAVSVILEGPAAVNFEGVYRTPGEE
jgi:diaminopimelate epimerase